MLYPRVGDCVGYYLLKKLHTSIMSTSIEECNWIYDEVDNEGLIISITGYIW